MDDAFKQALEDLKQRLPVEEVVRWYVPALKRQGALLVACCPFHEEKTPSFKVDPRRGTWRCYGACGTGGDQISFVERANRVEFREAVEILAARAGVTLPDRRSRDGRRQEDENRPLYDALERAERFFGRHLQRPEGRRALEYARARGLEPQTLEDFGVGWAPSGRSGGLVAGALRQGVALRTLVAAGLAREGDGGQARDFFFGRLIFPVCDLKGRTVGFGARRLDDAAGGPKYVNTPETVLFHKGRLIYGLDRALDSVRRGGHLVLVEGYTDVMAAHQAGLRHVAAVLGTATTDDHAALVRRSGARRVSLVFDGDDAGRRATHKALLGLLPLEVSIDVVRLPGGEDPCDLLVRPDGAAAFSAELERSRPWFEHLVAELDGVQGEARWSALDQLLELVARLPRPLAREELLDELARRLAVPVESVRAQMDSLPERRREALRRPASPQPEESGAALEDPRLLRDWRLLVGALLCEPELVEQGRAWSGRCPLPELAPVLEAVLSAGGGSEERVHAVLAALGEAPARHQVVPLLEEAAQYEDARELFADAAAALVERDLAQELEHAKSALTDEADEHVERERLTRLHATLLRMKRIDPGTARRGDPAHAS